MALKIMHVFLALLSFCSFSARFALLQMRPAMLRAKWMKIAPPVIDTALLLSGGVLAVQGGWFVPFAPWLAAKLIALCAYVAFGIAAMRLSGGKRWAAFVAALGGFGYIVGVAVCKNALLCF